MVIITLTNGHRVFAEDEYGDVLSRCLLGGFIEVQKKQLIDEISYISLNTQHIIKITPR